jgi:hypothetical protein
MKEYMQIPDIAHFKSGLKVLLLAENRAIINKLDVILHGFMSQIIYTIVFRIKWLNNLMFHVRLFNRLTRKTVV